MGAKTVTGAICLSALFIITALAGIGSFAAEINDLENTRAILDVGPGQTYTTIQAAIDAANAGDVINIQAGTFAENIIVDKTLTIQGAGREATTIDGSNIGNVTEVRANGCVIKDLKITNSAFNKNAGILLNSSNNLIKNCNISENDYGIWVNINEMSQHNNIEDCYLIFNDHGIDASGMEGPQGNNITNCYTCDSNYGVYIDGANNNRMDNVTSLRNSIDGIFLLNTIGNKISNCTTNDNYAGIDVSCAAAINELKYCTADRNTYGILIYEAQETTVIGCSASENLEEGLRMEMHGDDNIISECIFENNHRFQINISFDSDNNNLYANDLLSDTDDPLALDVNGNNYWYKNKVGNYYSNATGTDENGDGILDTQYQISGYGQSIDPYPLVTRYGRPNIFTSPASIAYENKEYQQVFNASDLTTEEASLIWTMNTNASWLDLSGSKINGTPGIAEMGREFYINLTVSDGENTDLHNYTIYVNNTNDPPVITSENIVTCYEDELYAAQYTASDIDPTNDKIGWYIETNASFLYMETLTGNLSGTPDNEDVGTYSVRVWITDLRGGSDETVFNLTVLNTNDPPAIKAEAGDIDIKEDGMDHSLNLLDWFTDQDGDNLTFSVDPVENITINIFENGTVEFIPAPDYDGAATVTFHANDSEFEVTDSIIVDIIGTQDPPVVSMKPGDITIDEDGSDSSILLPDVFSDIDGDELTYEFKDNGSIKITIFKNGRVALEPFPDWSGTGAIEFSATDGIDTASFVVNITVNPVNDPPQDVSIYSEFIKYYTDEQIELTALASDPDTPYGDTLTFRWESDIAGDLGTTETITPELAIGTHIITLNVTDSKGASAEATLEIEINERDTTIPDDDDDDDDDDNGLPVGAVIGISAAVVFILIVIVIVIVLIVIKGKKKQEQDPSARSQTPPQEPQPQTPPQEPQPQTPPQEPRSQTPPQEQLSSEQLEEMFKSPWDHARDMGALPPIEDDQPGVQAEQENPDGQEQSPEDQETQEEKETTLSGDEEGEEVMGSHQEPIMGNSDEPAGVEEPELQPMENQEELPPTNPESVSNETQD